MLCAQELFRQSAMSLQFSQQQRNFPEGLLRVRMYSLTPAATRASGPKPLQPVTYATRVISRLLEAEHAAT